jgi:glycosyltransferase involved in cell wall biosynthesis
VVSLQGLLQLYARAYFAGRTPCEVARLVLSRDFIQGRGVAHGYVRYRQLARQEVAVMRAAHWFIGRTEWDRAALAATNPSATYFHCDEIMRADFWDADWAATAGRRAAAPDVRLYSTSSIMPFKGTETLLEAAAVLRRRGVSRLRVRIAGVPPGSQVEGLYLRTARRLGVADVVDWLGRLDAGSIVDELESAAVFVYPSHIDNSPNALVEAMLAGAPIVASYAGGIPSMLATGEEGLLVPRGDAPALAGAVHALLDDPGLAARLGRAARERARRRNDPERIADRTLEIYRTVIAAAQDGRAGRAEVRA